MDRRAGVRAALVLTPLTVVVVPALAWVPLLALAVLRGVRRPPAMGLAAASLTVLAAGSIVTLANPASRSSWLGFAGLLGIAIAMGAWTSLSRKEDASALALGALAVLGLEAGWALVDVVALGASRASGTAFHPNVLGAVVTVCGIWVLGAVPRTVGRRFSATAAAWAVPACVLATLVPLLLSGSRTAMVAWVFGAVVLGALTATASRRARVGSSGAAHAQTATSRARRAARVAAGAGVLVAFVLLAAVSVTAMPELRARWSGLSGTLDPVGRPAIWGIAAEGIVARPLLGHGFGAWSDVARAIEPAVRIERMTSVHNGFLELALSGGTLLLVAMLAWIARLARVLLRRVRQGDADAVHAAAVATAFLVTNLAESFLLQGQLLVLAWLPIGLVLASRAGPRDDGPLA